MAGTCYPDRLIQSTPNLYYYAANNPSEATIAKRRSYASTISYLTPPAENAGLYKDVDLPGEEDDTGELSIEERDAIVGKVYSKIMEIESRLLPCGLHTVGVPPTAEEAVATLVNIASIDRPEDGIKSLPRLIAESIGRDIEQIYRSSDAGDLADGQLRQQIVQAVRTSVAACVERSTDMSGRVTEVNPLAAGMMNISPTSTRHLSWPSWFP